MYNSQFKKKRQRFEFFRNHYHKTIREAEFLRLYIKNNYTADTLIHAESKESLNTKLSPFYSLIHRFLK